MKQIVFLISALVVLLQLHSTTASADSQSDWDEIEYNVLSNTDALKGMVEKLKEIGETAWKVANVEAPAEWAEFLVPYIKLMDEVKAGFSELISELRKTASVKWEKIKPKIDEIVARITLNIEELDKIVADAAPGTEQEIDDSVRQVTEVLTRLMETEPVNTENVLKEAAQEELNAEQTDSQAGWEKTKAIILFNTESMNDWAKELKEGAESAWKVANAKAPEQWAELEPTLRKLLDLAKTKFSETIDKLKKIVPVEWADFESKISEVVLRIWLKLREIQGKLVDAAEGTAQEIDENVNKALEESVRLMKTETVTTINLLNEIAQEKLNAKRSADNQESQANE